jgi:hypothetical protein
MHNSRSQTYTHAHTSARTVARARTGPVGLRRSLANNSIGGTLPASLSALTALTGLCARVRAFARPLAHAHTCACERCVHPHMHNARSQTYTRAHKSARTVARARTGPVGLRRSFSDNSIGGTLPAWLSALTSLILVCARRARCRCGASVHLLHVRYVSATNAHAHARTRTSGCLFARVWMCVGRRVCLFVCTCMCYVLASTFVCCFRIDVWVCVGVCVCACVRACVRACECFSACAQVLAHQRHQRDVAGVALRTDRADRAVRPPRAMPMRRIRPCCTCGSHLLWMRLCFSALAHTCVCFCVACAHTHTLACMLASYTPTPTNTNTHRERERERERVRRIARVCVSCVRASIYNCCAGIYPVTGSPGLSPRRSPHCQTCLVSWPRRTISRVRSTCPQRV